MRIVNVSPQKHLFYRTLRILKDAGWRKPDRVSEDKIALSASWGNGNMSIILLVPNRRPTLGTVVLRGRNNCKRAVEKFNLLLASNMRRLKKAAKGLIKEGAPVKLRLAPEAHSPLFTMATLSI